VATTGAQYTALTATKGSRHDSVADCRWRRLRAHWSGHHRWLLRLHDWHVRPGRELHGAIAVKVEETRVQAVNLGVWRNVNS
jgi:hypothetical protein